MLKIVTVPAAVLVQPTKSVKKIDDKIKKIVFEMEKILVAQDDPPGVGLAANQVGLDLSLFIIKENEKAKTKVFINPKIISKIELDKIRYNQMKSDKSDSIQLYPILSNSIKKKRKKIKLEGCLSIPRIWGPVKRADKVLLEYQDLTEAACPERSRRIKRSWFSGFEAVIIQHEMDHLNGIVFTQRSLEQNRPIYEEKDGQLEKIDVSLK